MTAGSSGIVLLAADGASTRAIYHRLRERFGDIDVILEQRSSNWSRVRRRAAKLGIGTALGQVLFALFVVPVLRRGARRRIREITDRYGLEATPLPRPAIEVDTVNGDHARETLRSLHPRVVVVSGTRIIGRKTLESVPAPFINMHAGITPLYRGVHGGYWALSEARPELVGTTVHVVDEGIDTGRVIAQPRFDVTAEDNFASYPYLHTAAGLPALVEAVRQTLEEGSPRLHPPPDLPSRLRYHPTLWGYLWRRLAHGIR